MTRGKVVVVGLGPGDVGHMTIRAIEALKGADLIIGYKRYIDALAPLGLKAEVRAYSMGEEPNRARDALEAAEMGLKVAIATGGDPCVYGMASYVFEEAIKLGRADMVEVIPGVTAALAASSLLGSPISGDFAVISLSDYLVPRRVIMHRLEAFLLADVPVAIYNPSSEARKGILTEALELVRKYRGDEVPVGIVKNAYRSGQEVAAMPLSKALEIARSYVDMNSLIIVGSSKTALLGHSKMFTPRSA